jgi:hypothetical protein
MPSRRRIYIGKPLNIPFRLIQKWGQRKPGAPNGVGDQSNWIKIGRQDEQAPADNGHRVAPHNGVSARVRIGAIAGGIERRALARGRNT